MHTLIESSLLLPLLLLLVAHCSHSFHTYETMRLHDEVLYVKNQFKICFPEAFLISLYEIVEVAYELLLNSIYVHPYMT